MSVPGIRQPAAAGPYARSRRTARHLAAGLLGAVLAVAAPATARAAIVDGTLSVQPTDLGKLAVSWNVPAFNPVTSELLEGDRVVDRQVYTGAGAGVQRGNAAIVIPDEELYGSTPIQFKVRMLDASGTETAESPVTTVGPCPARPPRAKSPTGLFVSTFGAHFARVAWSPGLVDLCFADPTGYVVTANGVSKTVPAPSLSTTLDGLNSGTKYDVSVSALPASSVGPEAPATVTLTTDPGTDTSPPTKPGALSIARDSTDPITSLWTASWGASTDDVGVTAYDLYSGNTLLTSVPGTETKAEHLSLPRGTGTPFTVVARDAAGNVSLPTDSISVNTCPVFAPPPFPVLPTNIVVGAVTSTTATITWTPARLSGACNEVLPTSYTVYRADGTVLGTSTAAADQITLTGLQPGTDYEAYIGAQVAFASQTPNFSFTTQAVAPPTPTPGTGPAGSYDVAGSATLKNLVKGSVPLNGSMVADLALATQTFTGTLKLDQSTAKLTALGFLPVVAKVAFVPTAPVTGTFAAPALNVTAKMRIKLPSVTLFGLQLVGGSGCQTKAVSEIPLSSKSFDILDGGTLAGSFAIGDLTNCGGLTGIVSPLTAGKGNAIAIKLSPR